MTHLIIEIAKWIDDHPEPGIVECTLRDANRGMHTFIDKVSAFSSERLSRNHPYPCEGSIGCRIIDRWQDKSGRSLVRVTTLDPNYIESLEGHSEFTVLVEQVRES
jgi:hypothetical protein